MVFTSLASKRIFSIKALVLDFQSLRFHHINRKKHIFFFFLTRSHLNGFGFHIQAFHQLMQRLIQRYQLKDQTKVMQDRFFLFFLLFSKRHRHKGLLRW